MDKLKEKLKKGLNLNGSSSGSSSFFSSKTTAFAGTGHKLGTTESKAPPSLKPKASTSTTPVPARPPLTAAPVAAGASTSLQPPPPVLPSLAAAVSSSLEQPPLIDFTPRADDSIVSAIDQLSTDPHCAASAQILTRLIKNIVTNPSEDKYRKIRLRNPKIQSAIVDTHGGVELILACGFIIVFETNEDSQKQIESESESFHKVSMEVAHEENDGEREKQVEEGFAILSKDADLEPLQAAVVLLQQKWPSALTSQLTLPPPPPLSPAGASVPSAAPTLKEREWAAPCDRKTQVILPASVDTDVPSWFFERTGQDLKASFLATIKKREQSQILMTKAMREKLAKNGAAVPMSSTATVKVRLPEGISVQGEFSAGEPVAVVFSWVADCLCNPLQTFDLMLPDRRVLKFNTKADSNGVGSGSAAKAGSAAAAFTKRAAERPSSIKEAGLMPSITVYLKWTGPSAVVMKGVPALRRELYTQTAA